MLAAGLWRKLNVNYDLSACLYGNTNVRTVSETLFRRLAMAFRLPTIPQKFLRKPPVILKIVPKVAYEMFIWLIFPASSGESRL